MPKKISAPHIDQLVKQGCTAQDWAKVQVTEGFAPDGIERCRFLGSVTLGKKITLRNATLENAEVGDGAVIENIGGRVANYVIEADAQVLNVAELSCDLQSAFGQGTAVEVLNEGGGREVPLSNRLTAQIAHLIAVCRYRPRAVEALALMLKKEAESFRGKKGVVGRGAKLVHCGPIVNVRVGAFAQISGVAGLKEGVIDSVVEDPAVVGEGVSAENFVILPGAHVTSHALLGKCFVGEGARIGKQFSAENSLFFANTEGFHGEAVSLFAGPYAVTHHKSTLLIAVHLSFYNAGSGTNQSNHMYKLGPVHQGVLERGCKTGSFSYLLLECHLAPFCVVIGKHMTNLNLPDFPFSYLSESGGRSYLTPAMNLLTVGTVRDREKWASRDRRKSPDKKDIVNPEVYSPFTVEKMARGRDTLARLYKETPKEVESINVGGAVLSRLLLKNGAKYYEMAIFNYLCENLFSRAEPAFAEGKNWSAVTAALKPSVPASADWVDVAGLLCPREVLDGVLSKLETGRLGGIAEVAAALRAAHEAYGAHEWSYVVHRLKADRRMDAASLTPAQALSLLSEWELVRGKLHNLIYADAGKEFEEFAKISYGLGGAEGDCAADFKAVRGDREAHKVLARMRVAHEHSAARAERLKAAIERFSSQLQEA